MLYVEAISQLIGMILCKVITLEPQVPPEHSLLLENSLLSFQLLGRQFDVLCFFVIHT